MEQTDCAGQRELRLVGLSRSGNHAMINWMLAQMPGRTCFLNCVEPKLNPFATARETANGQTAICNYEPFDQQQEARGEFSTKDWLLYSYEDCFISMVCSPAFESRRDAFVGKSQSRTDVLILRDPFNLFASRLRSSYSGVTPLTAVRIWKQHARQVLGQRQWFTQPPIAILYNRWAVDCDYRREIASKLGLQFSDASFRSVASTGGGSSFDGLRYDGRAERMSVFDRWRHYIDDDVYQQMFDDEVLRLSEAIFGKLPAAELMRKRLSPTLCCGARQQRRADKNRVPGAIALAPAGDDLNIDVA